MFYNGPEPFQWYMIECSGQEGYKTVFSLNSAKHKIYSANKLLAFSYFSGNVLYSVFYDSVQCFSLIWTCLIVVAGEPVIQEETTKLLQANSNFPMKRALTHTCEKILKS